MSNDRPVVYFDISELVEDLTAVSDLSAAQITENVLQDYGSKIQTLAQEKAPYDTGTLRRSINYSVKGDRLTLEVDVPYGMYQEFGTGSRGEFPGHSYEIRPKKGRYLVFQVNGRTVYAKKVVHPGVEAQPYLRPAVQEAMGELYGKLAERGQAYILKGPNSVLT